MIDLQSQIIEKIYTIKNCVNKQELTGILKDILAYDIADICYTMGNFGEKLRAFAADISSHPDLFTIFDGELTGSFSKDASDLLKLSLYAKELNLSDSAFEEIKRIVSKHPSYKAMSKEIESPYKNLLHVRFIASRRDRDNIRSKKRTQNVNTNLIYSRKESFWEEQPLDFSSYIRFSNIFQKELDEANSRFRHFSDLGLKIMAEEIHKSIANLEELSVQSQYYGFNKISLTTASIILAKQMKYKYISRLDGLSSKPSPSGDVIIALSNSFYKFYDNDNDIEYFPRIYTFQELQPYASSETIKVVDYLEQFPETDGKPLFDHYRVLLASLLYPKSWGCASHYGIGRIQDSPFKIRLPHGGSFQSDCLSSVHTRLDVELLQKKEILGILLGERDGQCYFISYF